MATMKERRALYLQKAGLLKASELIAETEGETVNMSLKSAVSASANKIFSLTDMAGTALLSGLTAKMASKDTVAKGLREMFDAGSDIRARLKNKATQKVEYLILGEKIPVAFIGHWEDVSKVQMMEMEIDDDVVTPKRFSALTAYYYNKYCTAVFDSAADKKNKDKRGKKAITEELIALFSGVMNRLAQKNGLSFPNAIETVMTTIMKSVKEGNVEVVKPVETDVGLRITLLKMDLYMNYVNGFSLLSTTYPRQALVVGAVRSRNIVNWDLLNKLQGNDRDLRIWDGLGSKLTPDGMTMREYSDSMMEHLMPLIELAGLDDVKMNVGAKISSSRNMTALANRFSKTKVASPVVEATQAGNEVGINKDVDWFNLDS